MKDESKSFAEQVVAWVAQIPEGRVVTYGQLASLAGNPKASRAVASAMRQKGNKEMAWHRVVNAQGKISPGDPHRPNLQKSLLEAEGVAFSPSGRIDLKTYRWEPLESE